MPDYSKGLIYKLCCKDANLMDIYIGSTTNFKQRKRDHKRRCINENCYGYNGKVYQCIRENGGWDNWDMIQIKTVNATDRRHLETEERLVIEELKPTLNSCIPTRTHKEWYEANKEPKSATDTAWYEGNKQGFLEKMKAYYKENQDTIFEKKKAYYKENQDTILEKKKAYRESNRDAIRTRDKAWYEANKHRINETKKAQTKAYYQANREAILERRRAKKQLDNN